MKKIAIAIHGGAGTIEKGSMSQEQEAAYKAALQKALDMGYAALENGKSALDAVEVAVSELEDSHLFNAGKGAVFTSAGTHEMDASIMDGNNLEAGAISAVTGIKNPVQLARKVMEQSGHVFLSGEGAIEFGKTVNGEIVNIPSYSLNEGDVVAVREKSKSLVAIENALASNSNVFEWLTWNTDTKTGTFVKVPERLQIPENIKEQLIVELYSK